MREAENTGILTERKLLAEWGVSWLERLDEWSLEDEKRRERCTG